MRKHQSLLRFVILTVSAVLILLPFGVYASGTEENEDKTVTEGMEVSGNETLISEDAESEAAEREAAVSGNISDNRTVSENTEDKTAVRENTKKDGTVSEDADHTDSVSSSTGSECGSTATSTDAPGITSEESSEKEEPAESDKTDSGKEDPEETSVPESETEKVRDGTEEKGPLEESQEMKSEEEIPKETPALKPAAEPDPDKEKEEEKEEEKEKEAEPVQATEPKTPKEEETVKTDPIAAEPSAEKPKMPQRTEEKVEETAAGAGNVEEEPQRAEDTRTTDIKIEETEKTGSEETKPKEAKTEETKAEAAKKETEGKPSEEQKKETKDKEKKAEIPDRKKPEIRILGVEDRSANRRPLQIVAEFRDENLVKESVYARMTATNSGKKMEGITESVTRTSVTVSFPSVTEDDYYVLEAGCRDEAGNESTKKISFTENQKGAVAALKNAALQDGSVNEKEVVPEFHVSGVDEVTEVRADVNGRNVPVQFNKEGNLILKDPLTQEGEYTVQVTTKDASGNEVRSAPVTFEIDRTKPKIAMKKTGGKGKKNESYDVVITKDQKKDHFTEVLLDGRKLEKEEYTTLKDGSIRVRVPKKGKHTVRATARDAAGNTRTYSKKFTEGSAADQKSGPHAGIVAAILIIAAGAAVFWRIFFRKS